MIAVPTVRCLADPDTCTETYTHARQVIVDAWWRLHYAAHARGRQARADYAAHGTVHPVARHAAHPARSRALPPRATVDTPTTTAHR